MLRALNLQLLLRLTFLAFKSQRDLLRGLGLLVENGLGLTAESCLLLVVSPSLHEQTSLASLVLGHLVGSVLPALLALAVCISLLGNVHHLKSESGDQIEIDRNLEESRGRENVNANEMDPRAICRPLNTRDLGSNGCYWSSELLESPTRRSLFWRPCIASSMPKFPRS